MKLIKGVYCIEYKDLIEFLHDKSPEWAIICDLCQYGIKKGVALYSVTAYHKGNIILDIKNKPFDIVHKGMKELNAQHAATKCFIVNEYLSPQILGSLKLFEILWVEYFKSIGIEYNDSIKITMMPTPKERLIKLVDLYHSL